MVLWRANATGCVFHPSWLLQSGQRGGFGFAAFPRGKWTLLGLLGSRDLTPSHGTTSLPSSGML